MAEVYEDYPPDDIEDYDDLEWWEDDYDYDAEEEWDWDDIDDDFYDDDGDDGE